MTQESKSFVKSVSILFTGTVVAQLIGYLASPIISRQYEPAQAAYLGLFLRITTLGAALATARLELAFPLEKKEHHAFGIYRFSMRFSLLISLIALISLLIYSGIDYTSREDFFFLISLPIGIFLVAFFNQGTSWSLRNEEYGVMSRSSLLLSSIINGLKVLFGFLGGNFLLLIGATILGYFFSSFTFLKDYLRNRKKYDLTSKSKRTKAIVAKNSDLYTYNLPHVFIDLARDLLLASIIWNYYGKFEFGSFDHAYRMLRLPIVFVGAAIGQVLFRKCTTLMQERKPIFPMVFKIVQLLVAISIVPLFLIGVYGSDLFVFVFGQKWQQSGEMATLMIPWLMMNFITSPISHLPIILNKQRAFFLVNLVGTLSMLLIVSIPYWGIFDLDMYQMIKLLSFSQSAFLLYVIAWLLWLTKKADHKPAR